jgi:hypothetical protein
MRRFFALLSVASLAAFIAVMSAGAEQSYTDPNGDGGPGTDITSITVRNDQAGVISIQIASASPIVGNHAVAVAIDADKNQATGEGGDEAFMYGGPLVGAAFFNCASGSCVPTNPASFSAGAAAANVTEFRFNRSDIGNVTSFNFYAVSISIDPPYINFWDGAPNSGYFTYDLVFPQCSNGIDDDSDGKVDSQDLGCSSPTDENEADDPVNIRLGAATARPALVKAGRVVIISAPTTRVETSQPLDSGRVLCTASYPPGKKLRAAGSIVGGRAVCRIKAPLAARGKRVRGVMTVTYQTAKATIPFAFRVAR